MSKKLSGFTIKEKDLAEALKITPEKLDNIIEFFNSDPNDEWELCENDHFVYLNQAWQERLFSQHGAYAIARYMDAIEKPNLWEKFIEFITKHKERIRRAFISQKIQENCSSLTPRNNRHFLSKKDVIHILCTSYARLNKAFEDIQRSEDPMIIYEGFDDFEEVRYYSLSGLDKLSRKLAIELKNKDRRDWCKDVEIISGKTFKLLIDEEAAKKNKIQAAIKIAKKRDGGCCQITGQKPKKHNKFDMSVHHIYSKQDYPHLATSTDNLITLTETVHREFHSWNGGFDKCCTVDDLIQFVNEHYSERENARFKLNQIKKMFNGVEQNGQKSLKS